MRFDFAVFLDAVERRVRRIKGVSVAANLLLCAVLTALVVNLLLRFAFRAIPPTWGYVAPAVLLAALPGAFIVGWSKRPVAAHMLLRLDDALGSHARISSLYEVVTADRSGLFRDRLESAVAQDTTDWKRALPIPKRTVRTLSAGCVGLLLACVLPLIPLPQQDAVASALPDGSETSASQVLPSSLPEATDPDGSADRDDSPTPMEAEIDVSPRQPTLETSSNGENEEVTLDSVLDDLSSLSEGSAQVDAVPTTDELRELASAQEAARQALTDMVDNLREQMSQNPRPLTQQESNTLQDLASQTGDPEIEERTDDVVDEPDPDQIGEKLQDLLEEADPNAEPPESSPESQENDGGSSGPSETPQSTEISGDEEAGQRFLERAADELQEQADAQAEGDGQPQSQSKPRDDSDAEDRQDENGQQVQLPGDPDDLAQEGGSDGLGGPTEDAPDGEVGFVHEEAPSTVGEEGEFLDEFVTKGVPVEVSTTSEGTTTRIVDFEQMASIVHERGLPEEALESVRRYFELITGL